MTKSIKEIIKKLKTQKENYNISLPSLEQLEKELKRTKIKDVKVKLIIRMISFLIVITSISVLITNFIVPIFRIYGTSMNPTLTSEEIVLSIKTTDLKSGDIVAFNYNNKILVKRYIAGPGDIVDINESGMVTVNNVTLEEPYARNISKGNCDIELPYQVIESRIFVLGDNRETSLDSRSEQIGCVAEEQIIGKVIFRIWPLNKFGGI